MSRNEYICDCNIVHKESVEFISDCIPDMNEFGKTSYFFKLLGDNTRLRIIWALDKRELCVCDIANILSKTKSAVSHQLGLLRRTNLVKCRKDGKTVYYTISDDHVGNMLHGAFDHIHE